MIGQHGSGSGLPRRSQTDEEGPAHHCGRSGADWPSQMCCNSPCFRSTTTNWANYVMQTPGPRGGPSLPTAPVMHMRTPDSVPSAMREVLPQQQLSNRPALAPRRKPRHSSLPQVRTGPLGDFESLMATPPVRTATSTQAPLLTLLRALRQRRSLLAASLEVVISVVLSSMGKLFHFS
jgi:hypothetical protein